jgi:hypothetical protein
MNPSTTGRPSRRTVVLALGTVAVKAPFSTLATTVAVAEAGTITVLAEPAAAVPTAVTVAEPRTIAVSVESTLAVSAFASLAALGGGFRALAARSRRLGRDLVELLGDELREDALAIGLREELLEDLLLEVCGRALDRKRLRSWRTARARRVSTCHPGFRDGKNSSGTGPRSVQYEWWGWLSFFHL